ncbi:MAG: DUF1826 domain-containing protein [Bacteroidota bacterium]
MIKTGTSFANAAIGNDPLILQDIHQQDKNIAIFHRDIDVLSEEISQLIPQTIECRVSGSVAEIWDKLTTYAGQNLPQANALLNDISENLTRFQRITKATSFRLLLATVSTNMCRRFHTDINYLRLLCTYAGPGTLWLPDEAANLTASRSGGNNQEIVIDEGQIQQVNTGDIVILKGALYPKANAILHRSPTIEQSGEKRLLLRIDASVDRDNWA